MNVKGLNALAKRHKMTAWIKNKTKQNIQKLDPSICCLQETHFRPREICRLKLRGCRNIYHANRCQKKSGVAVPMSDKIDFKAKTNRDKEHHYIIIKRMIQQEAVTIVHIYAPNMESPEHIKWLTTH